MIGGSYCHVSKTTQGITLKRSRHVFVWPVFLMVCLVCYQVLKFEGSFEFGDYFWGESGFTLILMLLTYTKFVKLMAKTINVWFSTNLILTC